MATTGRTTCACARPHCPWCAPSERPVTVDISTINGTAVFGQDFSAADSTTQLTFEPGQLSKEVQYFVLADNTQRLARFFLRLSGFHRCHCSAPKFRGSWRSNASRSAWFYLQLISTLKQRYPEPGKRLGWLGWQPGDNQTHFATGWTTRITPRSGDLIDGSVPLTIRHRPSSAALDRSKTTTVEGSQRSIPKARTSRGKTPRWRCPA